MIVRKSCIFKWDENAISSSHYLCAAMWSLDVRLNRHINQWMERSPGVAIRCGCRGRDEYGYPPGDLQNEATLPTRLSTT